MRSACLAASSPSARIVCFARYPAQKPVPTTLSGQSNLPVSCPICEHSPLSAEDCNPNKSLRTTIKVFLRTAEKKKEAAKAKEVRESEPEPETPVEPTPAPEAAPETKSTEEQTPVENTRANDPEVQAGEGSQPVEEPSEEQAPHTEQVC